MWKQIEPFDLLKSIPAKNIVWLVITVTKIAFSLLQSTYQKLWQKHPEKTDTEKVPGLDKTQQTLRCKCFKVTRKAMCAFLNVWSFCHLSELILVFSLRAVALLSVRHSQHIGIMHKHVELLCFIIIQSCCFLLKFVSPSPLCIPVRSDVSDRIPALSVFHQKSKSVIGLCWFSPCKLPKARLPMIYWLLYQL